MLDPLCTVLLFFCSQLALGQALALALSWGSRPKLTQYPASPFSVVLALVQVASGHGSGCYHRRTADYRYNGKLGS